MPEKSRKSQAQLERDNLVSELIATARRNELSEDDTRILVLTELKANFGNEVTLMATEERLVKNAKHHRRGRHGQGRPSGSSASQSSKRPARPTQGDLDASSNQAAKGERVDAATSCLEDVIELLDVKEEVKECVHTDTDENGVQWPMRKDLPVWVVASNHVASGYKMTQTLDSDAIQHASLA